MTIERVSGVHIMAYRQEDLVAEIIEEAGLLPRPTPKTLVESEIK
jgi:methylenetetrahydrofolate reductase (NADPH)